VRVVGGALRPLVHHRVRVDHAHRHLSVGRCGGCVRATSGREKKMRTKLLASFRLFCGEK
jgi:hypothetical protein